MVWRRMSLFGTLLIGVGLSGCGGKSDPQTGPSIYTKDVPNGSAPKIGKANKTPGFRLSNEGGPIK